MAGLLRADLSEADFLTLAGCYSESTVSRVGWGWGALGGSGGADSKQEKQRLDFTGLRGDGDKGRRTNLLPAFHLEKKKKISPQTRRHESIGGKRSQSQTILQVLGADRRSCIPREEQEEALSSQPAPGPISEEP